MAKLWLTNRVYPFWAYLIRIAYWLVAIFISSLYLQYYSQQSWFKIGLMLISVLFVVAFLALARILDDHCKPPKS
ncbi:hypothetical protein [Psychromonas antarctica]|jgi:hypothetical protein|uniref:hypothetical protein n=1 Tax=Psychromonas antarctica TaxID=67573 RepID=UPI001EE87FD0|nr:hypothetical protein [Psychromonas antarctica]MCG6201744.1 hypothetical protein [Psychromonas antarctica]